MFRWACFVLSVVSAVGLAFAETKNSQPEFSVKLPDGTMVELIGLRYCMADVPKFKQDGKYIWWQPDGTLLQAVPDERNWTTSFSGSYFFVLCLRGTGDYSCKADNLWSEDLDTQPVVRKGKGFETEDLRRFVLRFDPGQKEGGLRIEIATGPWQVAQKWSFWDMATPDDSFFPSSEPVIMRCPEQKGEDVVAEITQTIMDEATWLLLVAKDPQPVSVSRNEGGKSPGLIRYIYRFMNFHTSSIDHFEFQKRPYNYWITFHNVSLEPDHKTEVKVELEIVGSLLGKTLPETESLNLSVGPNEKKDRPVLVCFCDLNQRPSRHYVEELVKKAEELKEKGIIVALVQSEPMDQNDLDNWIAKYQIPFPCGLLKEDPDKIRFAWGVKALPWLILTDPNHIVYAEGFGIDELNEKIATGETPGVNISMITGLVRDPNGCPVPDVHITLFQTKQEYVTDAEGRFITGLLPSDDKHFFYAVDPQKKLVGVGRLPAGEKHVEIEMTPAKVVSGQITDLDDKPVVAAQVTPLPMTCFHVLTNEEGRFDVGWDPAWEPSDGLCLMARNIERNMAAVVDINPQATYVKIQLVPALTLEGVVTNSEDEPISKARLDLSLKKGERSCGTSVKSVMTNENGYFKFFALPQLQEYQFHVVADGYLAKEFTSGMFNTIKDTDTAGTIVLRKTESTNKTNLQGQLAINVVDENRKPVEITVVQIWKKKEHGEAGAESFVLTATEKPGFYEINNIPVGKYHAISIIKEGFAPFWDFDIEVKQGNQEIITCVLSRGGTIEGFVTDEKDKPMKGIPVVINSILCRKDLITDNNGKFSARNLPDGHFSIIAEPLSDSPYETTAFGGGASCGTKGIHIVLKQKGELKSPKSLLGTNLLEMNELEFRFDSDRIKGKSILLCFWDMDQRTSRQCLLELAKKSEELATKGVLVVDVHTSVVEEKQLNDWLKENNIAFPKGMIKHNVEQTLFTWGVRGQPWLILADQKNIVRAEGFPMAELDGKIIEMTKDTDGR